MKVKTFVINKGTNSQYYGLCSADGENRVLYTAPNHWKTKKGAVRWAENHGHIVVEGV